MRIPRIFHPQSLSANSRIALDANAARHVGRVLRLTVGDGLILFDGLGGEFPASIIELGKRELWVECGGRIDANCESPLPITLAQGVSKGERMDYTIQKAVELGAVSAEQAVEFLLETARRGGRSGHGQEDALFPAVLADVEEIWRDLMAMAKDRTVDEDVRSSALFWVGQEATSVVTEGLAEVALDEDEDQGVRDAAVFALSQRSPEEGVPILMEVARTAREAETRSSAMFWLAQSEDERVYAFFEEILLGRGGG